MENKSFGSPGGKRQAIFNSSLLFSYRDARAPLRAICGDLGALRFPDRSGFGCAKVVNRGAPAPGGPARRFSDLYCLAFLARLFSLPAGLPRLCSPILLPYLYFDTERAEERLANRFDFPAARRELSAGCTMLG